MLRVPASAETLTPALDRKRRGGCAWSGGPRCCCTTRKGHQVLEQSEGRGEGVGGRVEELRGREAWVMETTWWVLMHQGGETAKQFCLPAGADF